MVAMAFLLAAAAVAVAVVAMGAPPCHGFEIKEATIDGIQKAFADGSLTSRQLVRQYRNRIHAVNKRLYAVIENNPGAPAQAIRADQERKAGGGKGKLHGVPVLLKDNIATADGLNTTSGSYALLGSVVPGDAFVVQKLRSAGAVILGKASLSEWSGFRDSSIRAGWSARGGQGINPYTGTDQVCGSSSGSAIAVAANLAVASVATQTEGSILCPAEFSSVVGIKSTVGLTSRAGIIPISDRQDTVGVIARTVSDAVHVLDVIAGTDPNDEKTKEADRWIPADKYAASLKKDGLKGKRLGIIRDNNFFPYWRGAAIAKAYEKLFRTLRTGGATLVDVEKIPNASDIMFGNSVYQALLIEFNISINGYLEKLKNSRVRSLEDVIRFNQKSKKEKIEVNGQELLLQANATKGTTLEQYREYLADLRRYTEEGLVKVIVEKRLDAVVIPTERCNRILDIAGFPGITVPAWFDADRSASGICFGGLAASEPKLIEIAYAFEQATHVRRAPPDETPIPPAPPAAATRLRS